MNSSSSLDEVRSPVYNAEPQTTQPENPNEDNFDVPAIINHQLIYLSIIAVMGTIGNLIVLVKSIILQRDIQRRSCNLTMTSTNYFVMSLSISNMGTLTISLAFYLLPYYMSFPINEFSCRYILPARELFLAVSIFSITFMGVDRYLMIFKVFRTKMNPFANKICVLMLWILSYLIFALPFSFVYKVVYVDGENVCDPVWNSPTERRAHITFLIFLNVLMPGVVVCLSYAGIIRHLKQVSFSSVPDLSQNKNNSITLVATKSKRIVAVSIMMVIAFWITYIPYALLALVIEFGDLNATSFEQIGLLHAIATCLVYSSAMVFPFILIFFSKPFKPKLFSCPKLSRKNIENKRINDEQAHPVEKN